MIFIDYDLLQRPLVSVGCLDRHGSLLWECPMDAITSANLMHDFALTENYIILYESPMKLDIQVCLLHACRPSVHAFLIQGYVLEASHAKSTWKDARHMHGMHMLSSELDCAPTYAVSKAGASRIVCWPFCWRCSATDRLSAVVCHAATCLELSSAWHACLKCISIVRTALKTRKSLQG